MKIISLRHNNPYHTRIVLSFIINSVLDYGDMDSDIRLLTWKRRQGRWAIAINKWGQAIGIVCMVKLSDCGCDGLLWLEVLPQCQHNGVGSALLSWAMAHTRHKLVVKSVQGAIGFYQRAGVDIAV